MYILDTRTRAPRIPHSRIKQISGEQPPTTRIFPRTFVICVCCARAFASHASLSRVVRDERVHTQRQQKQREKNQKKYSHKTTTLLLAARIRASGSNTTILPPKRGRCTGRGRKEVRWSCVVLYYRSVQHAHTTMCRPCRRHRVFAVHACTSRRLTAGKWKSRNLMESRASEHTHAAIKYSESHTKAAQNTCKQYNTTYKYARSACALNMKYRDEIKREIFSPTCRWTKWSSTTLRNL